MTPRLAGARWRLLVHKWAGRQPGHRYGGYGDAHEVTSDPRAAQKARRLTATMQRLSGRPVDPMPEPVVLEGTEFDELVVGSWCHIEQMNVGLWWMDFAGVTVHVKADRDGRPLKVTVHGPGDYNDAVEGCEYECTWSAP